MGNPSVSEKVVEDTSSLQNLEKVDRNEARILSQDEGNRWIKYIPFPESLENVPGKLGSEDTGNKSNKKYMYFENKSLPFYLHFTVDQRRK